MVDFVNRSHGVVVLNRNTDNDWFNAISSRAEELSGSSYRKFSEKKRKQTYKSIKVKNVKKVNQADIAAEMAKVQATVKRSNSRKGDAKRESTWGTWFKKRPTRDALARKGILRQGYFGTDIPELIKQDKVEWYARLHVHKWMYIF